MVIKAELSRANGASNDVGTAQGSEDDDVFAGVGFCTRCEVVCPDDRKAIVAAEIAHDDVKLDRFDILSDNQASVSIVHERSLLSNIRDAGHTMTVSGIGGQLAVKQIGDFVVEGVHVATVYYHPKSLANILCFHDLNEKFGASKVYLRDE